jgi:hypothetical protein
MPPKIPTPRKVALAIAAAGVVLLAAWYFYAPARPTHAIDAVPADAFVAIEIDVDALRKSGALAALFGDHDEQSLTKVCGFDPVDRMTDLVFTVPEGATGDFGVAVEASLTRHELARCAEEVVRGHGGDPTSDIVERGSYSIITPRSTSADAAKPARSMAYKRGSPVLVGPKSWVNTMVDTIEEASLGRGSPGEHVTLRQKLAAEITPAPHFLLTATALLDRSVRDKLKAEMLNEVGTADDSGTSMMLGVLGMTSGVLGLYEKAGDVHAVVDLHCDEEAQCAQVERLILKVRDDWSKMPALREFGLGTVLDHLAVDHHGTKLQMRASAPATDVVRWAKLFLDSKPIVAKASGAEPAASAPPNDVTADVPTQTLRVRVPEGTKPGDPISIRIPASGPGTNGQVTTVAGVPANGTPAGTKAFSVTVPGGPPAGSKPVTVTVPAPSSPHPP